MRISASPDLLRVAALPVRALDYGAQADALTEYLRRPEGSMRLRPTQAQALLEAAQQGGALLWLGVGEGKTLISALLPEVLPCQRPLLLVPAALRHKTEQELRAYSEHWRLSDKVRILSYEQLSQPHSSKILDALAPDLVIADEVHHLRATDSARTRRFLRYMRAHPCPFVGLSGTLCAGHLSDFSHLAALALGERSPCPLDTTEAQIWGDFLDARVPPHKKAHEGALRRLRGPDESPPDAYRRRLTQTPGVVFSQAQSCPASLRILPAPYTAPPEISEALHAMQQTWQTPGGDVIASPLEMARHARELSQGFTYRWEWPPEGPVWPWLDARAAWRRSVQRICQNSQRSLSPIDSEGQLKRALDAHEGRYGADAEAQQALARWRACEGLYTPVTRTEWLSQALIEWACDFAHREGPMIIWASHEATLSALRARGVPSYGAGDEGILHEASRAKTRTIAASVQAHGVGKNLQSWCKALVLSPSSDATRLEQLIGRHHRQGQLADEVTVWVCQHAPVLVQAMRDAIAGAKNLHAQTGQQLRLLSADVLL